MFCRYKYKLYLCNTEREIKTTFVLIVFYRLTF